MSTTFVDLLVELWHLYIKITIAYLIAVRDVLFGGPKKSLKNKVIVITGAGHGLGRELALQLTQLGANLALIDYNQVS